MGFGKYFDRQNYDVIRRTERDSGEVTEEALGCGSVSRLDAETWANDCNRIAQQSPCREKYEDKSYSIRRSDRDSALRSRAAASDRPRD
jgi:hypothetical protein